MTTAKEMLERSNPFWGRFLGQPGTREQLESMIEDAVLKERSKWTTDRYFCQRCGKRVGGKDGLCEGAHTCSPPEDVRNGK